MNCDHCDLALSLVSWHRQESMQIGRMLLEQQAADLSDSELLADGVSHGNGCNGKYRQTSVLCTCTILDASS